MFKSNFGCITSIISSVLIYALIIYILVSINMNKSNRVDEEQKRIHEARRMPAIEMASRNNAFVEWKSSLNYSLRGNFPTIELEKVWLQERPILFWGFIRDISTNPADKSQYLVRFEENSKIFQETILQLWLSVKKEHFDEFADANPSVLSVHTFRPLYQSNNCVAVIARVNSIRVYMESSSSMESNDIKIGLGELIDILYTQDVCD